MKSNYVRNDGDLKKKDIVFESKYDNEFIGLLNEIGLRFYVYFV